MPEVCAVTGASGYVGSRLAAALAEAFEVVPMGRTAAQEGIRWELGTATDVTDELRRRGVSVLVHAAWDLTQTKAKANWETNVEGSRRLIEQAQAAGVREIVFISTISAFEGARSEYGKSKLAVEKLVLAAGGTVVRPGLVWGERSGGMFGSLRQQVSKGGMVPVIGDGKAPQYLVHEDDLAGVVVRAARGEFRGRTLTVANPKPWAFRDLVEHLAAEQGKPVKLVCVPWRLIYSGLKTAEMLGLKLGFRSDSVTSFVYQDRNPGFAEDLPVRAF
ncbi:MAG: NAD(P)-dependent oxidoreductase [Bryocella sp.]